MIQERQYQILEILHRANGYVTVEMIAGQVGCSFKTIRNDMKILREFLQTRELGEIISKPNRGFCLEIQKSWNAIEAMLGKNKKDTELYSMDSWMQICELLLRQTSCQMSKLEEKLLLSRMGVEKAVNQAEEWLKDHGVSMTRKRGYGIQMEASEYAWRLAMWDLFSDVSRQKQEFGNLELRIQTERFLWGFDTMGVVKAINSLEEEFCFHFSFEAYQQLLFSLSLSVIRSRQKQEIQMPMELVYEGMEFDRKLARRCEEHLRKSYQMKSMKAEEEFIRFAIGIAEIQEFCDQKNMLEYILANRSIYQLTERIIRMTGNILGQDMEQDESLKNNLFLYLKTEIIRLKYGIHHRNPLKDLIKSKYPNIYTAAWSASLLIEAEQDLRIGEHEIAYLALHFGGALERLNVNTTVCILCNHGIGISQILREQIERSIPNIHVLEVMTTRDTIKIQNSSCDFLISSVPVGSSFGGKEVVEIGNVLQPWDIQAIQDKMKVIRKRKMREISRLPEQEDYLLFDEAFVFIIGQPLEKEELIKLLCSRLTDAGYVTDDFTETVLEREILTSTVLSDGVAIPHGSASCILRPVIAVAVLEQPVEWKAGALVDRVFLLALNLNERFHVRSQIIRFYSAIVTFLDNPEEYDSFRRLTDKKEIADYLNHLIKGEKTR